MTQLWFIIYESLCRGAYQICEINFDKVLFLSIVVKWLLLAPWYHLPLDHHFVRDMANLTRHRTMNRQHQLEFEERGQCCPTYVYFWDCSRSCQFGHRWKADGPWKSVGWMVCDRERVSYNFQRRWEACSRWNWLVLVIWSGMKLLLRNHDVMKFS